MLRSRLKAITRFSIRGLLILMVVFAVVLAWWHQTINKPRMAFAQLKNHAQIKSEELTSIQNSNWSLPAKWMAWLSGLEFDPASLTRIDNGKFVDLEFLHQFPNLKRLGLSGWIDKSELAEIKQHRKLQYLWIQTDVENLDFLAELKDLRKLILESPSLRNMEAMGNCKQLEELILFSCPIDKFILQKPLLNLTKLSLTDSQLRNTAWLSNLPNLRALLLHRSPIENLDGLEHCRQLTHLFLNETLVDNIGPVRDLTQLQHLTLSNTMVADLTPLQNLQELRVLSLPNTRVSDLKPLAGLTKVRDLDLAGTQIDSSQLFHLPVLIDFDTRMENEEQAEEKQRRIDEQSKNSLFLMGGGMQPAETTTLDLSNTHIDSVTGLTRQSIVTTLNLSNTKISDVRPLGHLAIRHLDLSHTEVSDVRPLNALLLDDLDLSHTLVSELPQHLFRGGSIDLSGSQLESLFPSADINNEIALEPPSASLFDIRNTPFSAFKQLPEITIGRLCVTLASDTNLVLNDFSTTSQLTVEVRVPDMPTLSALIDLPKLEAVEIRPTTLALLNQLPEFSLDVLALSNLHVNVEMIPEKISVRIVEFKNCKLENLTWLRNAEINVLVIDNCTFTENFEMPELTKLMELSVSDCPQVPWPKLLSQQWLERLTIRRCPVPPSPTIHRWPELSALDVALTDFDDSDSLVQLPSLNYAVLPAHRFTVSERSRLSHQLFGCKIRFITDLREYEGNLGGGMF